MHRLAGSDSPVCGRPPLNIASFAILGIPLVRHIPIAYARPRSESKLAVTGHLGFDRRHSVRFAGNRIDLDAGGRRIGDPSTAWFASLYVPRVVGHALPGLRDDHLVGLCDTWPTVEKRRDKRGRFHAGLDRRGNGLRINVPGNDRTSASVVDRTGIGDTAGRGDRDQPGRLDNSTAGGVLKPKDEMTISRCERKDSRCNW